MNVKNLKSALVLAMLTVVVMNVSAANVGLEDARSTASNFLKFHAASTPGSFRAPALADLRLVHAEASSVGHNINAYYAFNIDGGGFIIIAGEDRASQVLGYSDKGRLDFNRLPDNFKALMDGYKGQIEFLQTHPEYDVTPALHATSGAGIEPLIKTNWGQEDPYDWQCPVYNNEYCVVGCVATAMAQVMYYWRYPTTSPSLNSYYCYSIGRTVPALPEASFNYNLMLPSYCHWDWDNSVLVQDTYTDAQAQEVAKLGRYCGQAVRMDYSPEGSGAYTNDQLTGMKKFGYSSSARDVTRESWWSTNYTTAEWEAMIKEELDQRRPILYSANDPSAGGHAFICDGYNSEGKFHFNFGWYGTCDGWYASTALNMTHRDGDYLRFNSGHEMLLGVVPPTYCLVSADNIEASSELMVLGDVLDIQATNVSILTSYSNLVFSFGLKSAAGANKANSEQVNVVTADFEQGSTVSAPLTLPTTLETGCYTLEFRYSGTAPRSVAIPCESGNLNVVGHLAKYNAAFTIDDVTLSIDRLLAGTHPALVIDDVTTLIDLLLTAK